MRYLLLLCLCSQLTAASFEEVTPSLPEEVASLNGDLLIGGFIAPLSGQVFIHETDLQVRGAQDLSLQRSYIPPQILGRYEERDKADRYLLAQALVSQKSKNWVIHPHLSAGFNGRSSYFQLRDPSGVVLEFEIQGDKGILKTSSYGLRRRKQISVTFIEKI